MSIYTCIFILMWACTSNLFCADTLQGGTSLATRGDQSPPHQQVKSFHKFLMRAPQSVFMPPRQTQLDPDFENKRSQFEKLSSSSEDYPDYDELKTQLKRQCMNLNATTPSSNPLDAYMVAPNNKLHKQLQETIRTLNQMPYGFLSETNHLQTHACKVLIYIANQLDFSAIPSTDAPYQLTGISPAHQRSRYYLNKIGKQGLTPAILPEDVAYYYSSEYRQTTWIANLLIALNQSRLNETQQKAQETLQRFVEALPNLENGPASKPSSISWYIDKINLHLKEASKKPLSDDQCASLDAIYHDALTSEFICKENNKATLVNPKLGFIIALFAQQPCICDKQPKEECLHAHSQTFIAKYMSLHDEKSSVSPNPIDRSNRTFPK